MYSLLRWSSILNFFCLLAQVKVDQNQAAELLKNQSQSQVGVYGTCLQNQYMKAMLLNSALCGKERSILPVDSQLLFVGYITVLQIKKKLDCDVFIRITICSVDSNNQGLACDTF